MSDELRVNGNLYSWSSAELKINGELFTGITDITFGDKRDRPKGYGMGRSHKPRGMARGKYETDPLKLTCFKDTAEAIRVYLAGLAADGISFGDVSVPIVLQYIENGATILLEFEECKCSANTGSDSEGPDPLKEDLEFVVIGIKRNGRTLYDSSAG